MNGRSSLLPRHALAAVIAATAVAAVGQQVVIPPNLGVPAGGGSLPSPGYDVAFASLAAGDFSAALEAAIDEHRGCMKFGNERWIDSIAAAALVGECHFELGDFRRAVAAYDESLALAAQHPDWLLAAQFQAQPARAAGRRAATWGRSGRNTAPAQLPSEVPIARQGADAQQVLQKGGVLAAPFMRQIRAQEIMRALTIAIYRRAEILGALGQESATLGNAARALARRAAPANHYSQSWIDVALGTALWAQGKPDQAKPLLERGLTIAPALDHALTPWGLLVLGRITLDADPAGAAKCFEEATYAAADFGDARALEEGFRLAFAAHMLAGMRGVPATIRAAGDVIDARDGLDVLGARLMAMRAEALATAGDPAGAAAALKTINPRLLRGEPGRGTAGAEVAYASALAALATGDVPTGDAHVERALALARERSTRLFQTLVLVELVAAGDRIADRRAEELFTLLLGPPRPRDFGLDPLGTLAMITAPRRAAFDAWFHVVGRGGLEKPKDSMFDVAEATRRDHWTSSRPLGGRLVAAERLLAAAPEELEPAEAARRAAILAERRDLGPLLDRVGRQRAALAAAAGDAGRPADGVAPRDPAGGPEVWSGYARDAAILDRHAAMLAAGREAVVNDFPPLTPAAEIRRRLPARHYILSFHWTARGLSAALESRDEFVMWDVRKAAGLPAEIAQLARGMCLFDAQGVVGTDKLLAADWRGPAAGIERLLFENSRVNLAERVDELVIVPDGLLWYVPFELLPISSAPAAGARPDARPLGEICRVRYCPTRSLAVAGFAAPRLAGPVGIHVGRMSRADDAAAIDSVRDRLTGAVERAVPVTITPGGPPGGSVASIFDALALFDESTAATLVPPAAGKGGLTFADWRAAPAKRARVVVVPGLQTAMADGLRDKSLPARPGDDLFLPATDLLAAGARTALISRWRAGGGTCVDLMTEFLRESTAAPADPPESAAALWRRALDVVTAEPPDLRRETRLRQHADDVLPDARHPFLWAGYLLVDCGSGTMPPAAAPAQPPVPAAPAVRPAAGAAP